MDYLKVWTSFREVITQLNDAEKGRLFDAMLMYAETGEEPSEFKGNERFLWPVAKQDIDRTAQKCETLKANASKGGIAKSRNNQTIADDSRSYQTLANCSKDEQTEAKPAHKYNVNIKKNNNKEIEYMFERFWNVYPRHEGKQNAIKAFEKIKPDEELLAKMIAAVERQQKSAQWQENGGQYIPHPATWLNGKRWEDEVTAAKPDTKKTVVAQQYDQRDYSQPLKSTGEILDFMARAMT